MDYLVLVNEGLVDDPRGIADDFIHPAAVSERLVSLLIGHHSLSLVPMGHLITAAPDKQVNIRKHLLHLLQGTGMSIMEQVIDAVAVDTDWPVSWNLVLGQMGVGVRIDFGLEADILGP